MVIENDKLVSTLDQAIESTTGINKPDFSGRVIPKIPISNEMKFELGKYYQHTTGHKIYICGIVESIIYGRGLAAEDTIGNLQVVGSGVANAVNYVEITKEKFMEYMS